MAAQASPRGPRVLSCIHVAGDNEESEDYQRDTEMEEGSSDLAPGDASPGGDGRESPVRQESIPAYRPRFRSGSQGPLGAKAIVDSMQALKEDIKKVDNFLDTLNGGHSDAAEVQEWAELHANADRLAKNKEEIHKYLKKTVEQAEARRTDQRKWLARFTDMADIDPHKMLLIRDRLPANLGPAVARLITFCYYDDDSIDKMPKRYRDLMGKDLAVIARQATPAAPSQDVSALRRDLQYANEQLETAHDDNVSKERAISDLVIDKEMAVVTKDRLRRSMTDMSNRHKSEVDVLKSRAEESSLSAKRNVARCAEMLERLERQEGMLVESVEEKRRLVAQAGEARQQVVVRDERIKQLEEKIALLVVAEKGSDSAINGLKKTIERQDEQNALDQASNARLINDMRHKNWLEEERQRSRITQLERQVDRLQLENGEIRGLKQERSRLEGDVDSLTDTVTSFKEKQDDLTRQNNRLWEEKRALGQEKDELDIRIQKTESDLEQLRSSYKRLQRDEASYIEHIDRLKMTIEGKDSDRKTAQLDLAKVTSSWETKYNELKRRNEDLERGIQESDDAIRKAQQLVQSETKLKAEVARCWRKVEDIQKEVGDGRAKLSLAEDENRSLQQRLDTSTAETGTLRADAEQNKATVDNLTKERSSDHEKLRDLDAQLRKMENEKSFQLGTAARLKEEARVKGEDIVRLTTQVAKSGAIEEEKERLLVQERRKVERLGTLVLDAQNLLESERQNSKQLAEKMGELESAIRTQQQEAGASRGLLLRSIETEKEKSQQLQQGQVELEASVKTLREQHDQDAGRIGQLERALEDERSGRMSDRASSDQDHGTLVKKVEDLEKDSMARTAKLKELEGQVLAMDRSLSDARAQAQEGVEGLQGFIARLCLGPAEEPAAFEGLARQIQARGTLELLPAEQQHESGWVILEPWDEEPGEDPVQHLGGLDALVLDLFRHAVVGRLGGRRCYHTLQQTIKVVQAGTVIHTGIFRETARAFLRAISASPSEGFQAGLVFWQLLTAIGQNSDLEAVRDELTGVLSGHGCSSIFRLVAGREQLSESEECHFFSDKHAVVARATASSAALVDCEGQSVRFFAKSRWAPDLQGFRIKPISDQQELLLPSTTVRDIVWAEVMEVA